MAQVKKPLTIVNRVDDTAPEEIAGMRVEWVDEVPPTNTNFNNPTPERIALIEALKSHRGKWAKIANANPQIAQSARSGTSGFTPRGAFEGRARRTSKDQKSADVYLRYVGEPGEPVSE